LNISVEAENLSLEAIGRLLEASEAIRFASSNRQQVYGWAGRLLVQQVLSGQGLEQISQCRKVSEAILGTANCVAVLGAGLNFAKTEGFFRKCCSSESAIPVIG
jgi:hypothetical protein